METIFGDGSQQQRRLHGRAARRRQAPAHRRVAVHDGVLRTAARARRSVAFGAPYPGKIIPVHLAELGGELIAQKDSFLCAAKGVQHRHRVPRRSSASGCSAAKASSCSACRATGSRSSTPAARCIERDARGRRSCMRVDTGCIVALQPTVELRHPVRRQDQERRCSAAKGCSSRRCAGPGSVWLQSLPLSRLAGRIVAAVPGPGAAGAKKARCSAVSAGCSTATTTDDTRGEPRYRSKR